MLCVIARIDEQSKQKLRLLQKAAECQGIPLRHLHGHITLAVYSGDDVRSFTTSCKRILLEFAPFTVHYDHLKILWEPSTIVACPLHEGILADLQKQIVDEWAKELHIWSQPGVWVPHTTLFQNAEADLDSALAEMEKDFEPFTARISSIEFSAVRETGYEIIETVELQDKKSGSPAEAGERD